MRKIFIMGASSGIGLELALIYIAKGYIVGIAARRKEELEAIKKVAPDRVFIKDIDITKDNATYLARELVDEMQGMDIYFHSSGIGYSNKSLDCEFELNTLSVNCLGFTRMLDWAMLYFEHQGYGHIGAISSVAGTKGLGAAPAYSASKAYQQTYLQALAQRANNLRKYIFITDIRPGFVDTPFLKKDKYPMMMTAQKVGFEIEKALRERKRVKTIDHRYRVLVFVWKMIPNNLYERLPIQ